VNIYGPNQSADAGEITADFVNFKPGKYDVKLRIKFKLYQGVGNVGAKVTPFGPDGTGGYKTLLKQEFETTYDRGI
jgi:hypothetical protein